MSSRTPSRLELRTVRNARLLCAGPFPVAIWFPLVLLACGVGVVALTWTSGSRSAGALVGGAVMAAAGILGLLDYPLLRALAKLSANAAGETAVVPELREPTARRNDVRAAFLVLVPAGAATIVAALVYLDAVAAPSWAGVAMGAAGGMTIATGVLGAAAPPRARGASGG